jgi:hypothetical protein
VAESPAHPVHLVLAGLAPDLRALSAKRSMPEAPIGLDDSTPPEQVHGMSPP